MAASAGMVELAYQADLKSAAQKACGFESRFQQPRYLRTVVCMTLQGVTFLELWEKRKATIANMVRKRLAAFPNKENFDLLMAAAQVALWEASCSYNEERGVSFWEFAKHRINGALVDEMRTWDHLGRVGRARVKKGETKPWELVRPRSITSVEGILVSGSNPEHEAEVAEKRAQLKEAIQTLRPQERLVATKLLLKQETVGKIAVDLHVSATRISQLRQKVIDKLREYFCGR